MWERWCTTRGITALTADPAVLCAYLVERAASGIAITSLDLACTAIRHVHRTHGLVDPAEDETVRRIRLGGAAWLNERGSEPGVLFTRIWQTSKDRAMTSPWGEVPSNTYVPTSDGRRVANS